jgi:hypothetical protein
MEAAVSIETQVIICQTVRHHKVILTLRKVRTATALPRSHTSVPFSLNKLKRCSECETSACYARTGRKNAFMLSVPYCCQVSAQIGLSVKSLNIQLDGNPADITQCHGGAYIRRSGEAAMPNASAHTHTHTHSQGRVPAPL